MQRITTAIAQPPISRLLHPSFTISALPSRRFMSNNQDAKHNQNANSSNHNSHNINSTANDKVNNVDSKSKEKTVAQLDEELRKKMSGLAGEGGEAGVEYEDGKPVAMKRGVRNNMFRYI
ncbi:hypothetical protein GGR51DRAFT_466574 [Nemania sp. FL0031]|nr:hypothetical protein GGR51DRAFT_466574 [Nemania sp. FL0031]